jgi:hypothetical protein
LILTAAMLGLVAVISWRVFRDHSSAEQLYVGRWRFSSGQVKAGPGFFLSDKAAPDGTTTKPIAGNMAVVEVRDGVLWYTGDDKSCRYQLRIGDGKAEIAPGGKVECDSPAPDGALKQTDAVRLSMVVEAQDRAHIWWEARASFERQGQRRDVTLNYDGIAVREVLAAK